MSTGTPSPAELKGEIETRLRSALDADVRVTLCPRARLAVPGEPWLRRAWKTHLAGALSLHAQPPYAATSGPEQVATLARLLAAPVDWLFAQNLHGLSPVLRLGHQLPPVLFDIDDIPHRWLLRKLRRAVEWRGEYARILWLPQIVRAEATALRLARVAFTCSPGDAAYLGRRHRAARLVAIPNAVDAAGPPPIDAGPPRLLFIGNMDYPPNVASAAYLVSVIWPAVLRRVPSAELWLAGPMSDRLQQRFPRARGVSFLGYVDDLDRLYAQVRVAACPIVAGAGTRVKIVEAAAHGKAIVATSLGAEGLDFADGAAIAIRDRPSSFAEACIELLTDERRALSLARAAYAQAIRTYSRRTAVAAIGAALDGAGVVPARGAANP